MDVKRDHLDEAAKAGVITTEQAGRLWDFLREAQTHTPGFRPAHVLYYLGGLIAISALSLFVTLAWDDWAGWPMLALSVAFAVLGVALTDFFLHRKQLPIPAGIMITFAVALTPLAVFSLQHALGFWEGDFRSRDFHRYIDWRWILMELATLLTAAIAFFRYRMPFLLFPTSVVLWYLQMDLVPFIFNDPDHSWELRKLTSLYFGLLMVLFAFWVDVRSGRRKDHAFWLYLFGVMTFWCGLTFLESDSELSKFLYFCINLLMLAIGTALQRRVFAVFAAFGMLAYLGHLSHKVFQDSLMFPVAVAVLGLAIVFLGVLWQRHEQRLNAAILGMLPAPVRDLVARAHQ
jgi:hypothetical protein